MLSKTYHPFLDSKPCLDLGLIKRIYCAEEENLESEYADVFEGLSEIKGVQHKFKFIPMPSLLCTLPVGFLSPFTSLLNGSFKEWRKLGVIKKI